MGLMDELRRLARPYEDEDEEYDEELEEETTEEEEEPAPRRSFRRETRETRESSREPRESRESRESARSYRGDSYDSPYRRPADKVVNINTTTQLQVVLVKPERFENASRDRRPPPGKAHRGAQPGVHQQGHRPPAAWTSSPAWPTPTRARSRRWPSPPTSSPPTMWTSWGI